MTFWWIAQICRWVSSIAVFLKATRKVSFFSLKEAEVRVQALLAAGTMAETVVITVCAVPKKPVAN